MVTVLCVAYMGQLPENEETRSPENVSLDTSCVTLRANESRESRQKVAATLCSFWYPYTVPTSSMALQFETSDYNLQLLIPAKEKDTL